MLLLATDVWVSVTWIHYQNSLSWICSRKVTGTAYPQITALWGFIWHWCSVYWICSDILHWKKADFSWTRLLGEFQPIIIFPQLLSSRRKLIYVQQLFRHITIFLISWHIIRPNTKIIPRKWHTYFYIKILNTQIKSTTRQYSIIKMERIPFYKMGRISTPKMSWKQNSSVFTYTLFFLMFAYFNKTFICNV